MEPKKPSIYYPKVTCPNLPKVIKRKGCLEALAAAKDYKIIYISGKPGQGKTTLALAWLKESRIRPVWLTLDENDNDPANFFLLLKEAFSTAFPEIEFDPPPVPAGASYDAALFARAYCFSLFNQVPSGFALVLDEFHLIKEDGPVCPVIVSIAGILNPNVKLVIISRSLHASFMGKFIAKRQLFPVSEGDLRFSDEEVIELFEDILKIPIDPSQAKALNKITDGWVTGLILLKERVRKGGKAMLAESIACGYSDETLSDYFYHEVFLKMDESIKELMLKTSLFDSFSAEDAFRITGSREVRNQIKFLTRHYLLSEIQSGEIIYYRYHSSVRQFLKIHIMAISDEKRHNLVNQAGSILEEGGRIDEATTLYLTYSEYDHAICLIERIGLKYTLEGLRFKLKQWIRSIPNEKIRDNPWLQFFLATEEAFSNPSAAIQSYGYALNGFEQTGNIEGELWVRASRIITRFYMGQDYRLLNLDARRGRRLIRLHENNLSPLVRVFFLIADSISELMSTGHLKAALKKVLAAADLSYQAGAVPLYIQASIWGGEFAFLAGQFRLSASLFSRIEEAVYWSRINPVLQADALMHRGNLESFLGMRENALSSFLEAVSICQENGLISLLFMAKGYLIRQQVIMGKEVESIDELESMQRQIIKYGNQFMASFLSYLSAISLFCLGRSQEAIAKTEEAIRLLEACNSPFIINIPTCILGLFHLENGDLVLAEQYLSKALCGFKKEGSLFFSFLALLGLTKCSLDRGREKKARELLSRALSIGKKEGYREGDGLTQRLMKVILTRAREWGIEPDYVDTLMKHWKIRPAPFLSIHTLGRFEVAVNEKVIAFNEWKGKKNRLFLIAFVTNCIKDVSRCECGISKDDIIDLLWPEAEGDLALTSFYTTLHRLQTVLSNAGGEGLIYLKGGLLFLKKDHCYLDFSAFEDEVSLAKECESKGQWKDAHCHLEEAKAFYKGEYLPIFRNEAWIEAKRETLHSQFIWVEERLNSPRYKQV